MEIGAQQQAVGHLMGALLRVGADMSGLERRQGVLLGDSVRPAISLRDGDSECSLAESWRDQLGRTVASSSRLHNRGLFRQGP
jgi:hypothetical protein